MYKLFTLLTITLFCLSEAEKISIDVFRRLSDINNKWLHATSFPEAAFLLQHPPYSYHSQKFSLSHLNASELLYLQNESSTVLFAEKYQGSCSDDVVQILFNLRSQWALQMLDSDGKLSSGILRGGLIWPGHFSECNDVYAPLDSDGHGGFHGKYCATSWSMNLGGQYSKLPLTIGICVPESCTSENIKIALINASQILDRFPGLKQYSSLLSLNSVSCKDKVKKLDTPSILYLTIIIAFSSLTIIGSTIALIDNWNNNHRAKEILNNEGVSNQAVHPSEEGVPHSSERSFPNTTKDEIAINVAAESIFEKETSSSDKASLTLNAEFAQHVPKIQSDSTTKRILLCFSAFANGKKILNTDGTEGQLLSIHGIRFLSLTWVILGHTYITSVSIIGNRLDVLKEMDSIPFQMLLQAPFSVDAFFLLSGFLLAYLFFKEADKKNGRINWLYFYGHRIWRLTPAYMVVVFFYMFVFKYLGSGPFWDDNHCDTNRGSWWKYLLYINNFIPIHQMCVGWSWYLANDMQFYVISPLFLYPLWRWPAIGFSILSSFLIATWAVTGILSYKYDLIPMFVGVTHTKDFAAYEEKMWNSFDLIYDKPYCRIAPYIIGVILGYLLYRVNQHKNFLTWWQQGLCWMVAAFCSLSVVFGLFHVEMSKTTAMFYNTFCRSSFSVGLAWLIFACETGHGGFITKLLSWKFWIPMSRLTYCAYLIHPIIIHGYYQAYQTALYFTEFIAVTNFLGFLIMSFGLAFLFSLTFESPLMNLEKLLLKSRLK